MRNWKRLVRPDDVVWVIGDLSSGSRHGEVRALELLMTLPGIKHCILGNHDSPHPMHRDAHKRLPAYADAFATVASAARRRVNGQNVLLSHFPYTGDHTDTERYKQWRLPDMDSWLIHGHTHSAYVGDERTKEINVGLEAWDFSPVNVDNIAKEMTRRDMYCGVTSGRLTAST